MPSNLHARLKSCVYGYIWDGTFSLEDQMNSPWDRVRTRASEFIAHGGSKYWGGGDRRRSLPKEVSQYIDDLEGGADRFMERKIMEMVDGSFDGLIISIQKTVSKYQSRGGEGDNLWDTFLNLCKREVYIRAALAYKLLKNAVDYLDQSLANTDQESMARKILHLIMLYAQAVYWFDNLDSDIVEYYELGSENESSRLHTFRTNLHQDVMSNDPYEIGESCVDVTYGANGWHEVSDEFKAEWNSVADEMEYMEHVPGDICARHVIYQDLCGDVTDSDSDTSRSRAWSVRNPYYMTDEVLSNASDSYDVMREPPIRRGLPTLDWYETQKVGPEVPKLNISRRKGRSPNKNTIYSCEVLAGGIQCEPKDKMEDQVLYGMVQEGKVPQG